MTGWLKVTYREPGKVKGTAGHAALLGAERVAYFDADPLVPPGAPLPDPMRAAAEIAGTYYADKPLDQTPLIVAASWEGISGAERFMQSSPRAWLRAAQAAYAPWLAILPSLD